MARRTIPVDKGLLQTAIELAEKDGPLTNQSELWKKAAEYYNSNDNVEPITHSVVYLRFGQFGLTCKTSKGKKGRGSMTEEQKAAMAKARKNAVRVPKAERFKQLPNYELNIERVRACTPQSLHGLIDRMAAGSRVAAEKLHCLQCAGFDRSVVRECTGYSCPLFLYRPYQKVEDDAEDNVEETS
jgi:hypothetical protein